MRFTNKKKKKVNLLPFNSWKRILWWMAFKAT